MKKYIKYILLLLISILCIDKAYADSNTICYYIGDGFKASFDYVENEIYVDSIDGTFDHDKEPLLNYNPFTLGRGGIINGWSRLITGKDLLFPNQTATGYSFPYYFEEDNKKLNDCPAFLVIEVGSSCRQGINDGYKLWGTSNKYTAEMTSKGINDLPNCVGRYASAVDDNGNKITAEDYYRPFIDQGLISKNIIKGQECESLFGKKDANGEYFAGKYEYNDQGEEIEVEPPALGYIINRVMTYIRIAVPIIVILLGSLDLAKAVIAGKEEDMKKAQSTFIKRVLIGVAIFFIPALVNVVMWIADIAWQGLGYAYCTLD